MKTKINPRSGLLLLLFVVLINPNILWAERIRFNPSDIFYIEGALHVCLITEQGPVAGKVRGDFFKPLSDKVQRLRKDYRSSKDPADRKRYRKARRAWQRADAACKSQYVVLPDPFPTSAPTIEPTIELPIEPTPPPTQTPTATPNPQARCGDNQATPSSPVIVQLRPGSDLGSTRLTVSPLERPLAGLSTVIEWQDLYGIWHQTASLEPQPTIDFTHTVPDSDLLACYRAVNRCSDSELSSAPSAVQCVFPSTLTWNNLPDSDGDGIHNAVDNCPEQYNPGQEPCAQAGCSIRLSLEPESSSSFQVGQTVRLNLIASTIEQGCQREIIGMDVHIKWDPSVLNGPASPGVPGGYDYLLQGFIRPSNCSTTIGGIIPPNCAWDRGEGIWSGLSNIGGDFLTINSSPKTLATFEFTALAAGDSSVRIVPGPVTWGGCEYTLGGWCTAMIGRQIIPTPSFTGVAHLDGFKDAEVQVLP